jgi:hypothetical protein
VAAQPLHLLAVAAAAVKRLRILGVMVVLVVADTVAPLQVQEQQAKEMLARRGLTMGLVEVVVAQDRKAE